MNDFIDELLESINFSRVRDSVNQFSETSGIPWTMLKQSKVERVRNNKHNTIYETIDILSSFNEPPIKHTQIFEFSSKNEKLIYESEYFKFDRKLSSVNPIINAFLAKTESLHWHGSKGIWKPGDGLAFALDSKMIWPHWVFLGTEKELPSIISNYTFRGRPDDDFTNVEENLLGIHEDYLINLFPCKMIRLVQDLIRISYNRLSKNPYIKNAKEKVSIGIELGPMGQFYLQNTNLNIKYVFKNKTGKIIADNIKEIKYSDIITTKVHDLESLDDVLPDESEIYDTKIELRAGEHVLDSASGGYIRDIRSTIKVNQ